MATRRRRRRRQSRNLHGLGEFEIPLLVKWAGGIAIAWWFFTKVMEKTAEAVATKPPELQSADATAN